MFTSRVVLPSAMAAEKPKSLAVMAVAMAVVVVRTKNLFTQAVDCLAPNGPCKFNEVLSSYIYI